MKITRNRFERGSGVYNCTVCGRRTRSTGGDNTNLKQCAECYEVAGLENLMADEPSHAAEIQTEINRLNAIVISKGGKL